MSLERQLEELQAKREKLVASLKKADKAVLTHAPQKVGELIMAWGKPRTITNVTWMQCGSYLEWGIHHYCGIHTVKEKIE